MLTRLIIRLRLRGARKTYRMVRQTIDDWRADAEALHPESLERGVIERMIGRLLEPELDHWEALVRTLEYRLHKT